VTSFMITPLAQNLSKQTKLFSQSKCVQGKSINLLLLVHSYLRPEKLFFHFFFLSRFFSICLLLPPLHLYLLRLRLCLYFYNKPTICAWHTFHVWLSPLLSLPSLYFFSNRAWILLLQVSISPTFYVQLLCWWIPKA